MWSSLPRRSLVKRRLSSSPKIFCQGDNLCKWEIIKEAKKRGIIEPEENVYVYVKINPKNS